jgi:hypothetical protein
MVNRWSEGFVVLVVGFAMPKDRYGEWLPAAERV